VAHIGETLRGNTEGRKFVVETHFARFAREISLSSLQRELIVGSLLGDAYLMPTTSGFCFRVNHGKQQREYVDWKFRMLAELVRTPPRESGKCYYFRTVTHPEFSRYREYFYSGRRKIVPIELLQEQFTEFSLAVWLMDDGAVDRRQVRLNTQSFSLIENEVLLSFLRAKFGIEARLNRDKDRCRLRVNDASIQRFKRFGWTTFDSEHAIQASPVTTSRAKREMEVTVLRDKSKASIKRHQLERVEGIVYAASDCRVSHRRQGLAPRCRLIASWG